MASPTVHIRPHAAVAERVLLPGDPGRALRLAQQLLDAPKMLNHNRGLWGYTGEAGDGAPLTVQSTGMGCPSAGIVYEELIELGARRLLRVGTCGAIGDGLRMADTVIGLSASAVDTTPLQYAGVEGYAASATYSLVESAVRLGRESGGRVHI